MLAKLTAWESQTQDKDLQDFIGTASKEVAEHRQEADDLVTRLDKTAPR